MIPNWAKFFFFFGGGEGNLAERNLGRSGGKTLKIFEIFIPEIVANACIFKNWLVYMENSSINISEHSMFSKPGGGGGGNSHT